MKAQTILNIKTDPAAGILYSVHTLYIYFAAGAAVDSAGAASAAGAAEAAGSAEEAASAPAAAVEPVKTEYMISIYRKVVLYLLGRYSYWHQQMLQ